MNSSAKRPGRRGGTKSKTRYNTCKSVCLPGTGSVAVFDIRFAESAGTRPIKAIGRPQFDLTPTHVRNRESVVLLNMISTELGLSRVPDQAF
ncbi:hypothetical protein N7524_006030 [Penicillium chrysogenum]|nr:hypothetical protein N7524_006030 [Penicillium chrysogenum]